MCTADGTISLWLRLPGTWLLLVKLVLLSMAFGYATCFLYATNNILREHQQHLIRLPICSAISTALMEKKDSVFHFCEQQIQSDQSEYNWLFRNATSTIDQRWQRYTFLHSIIPWEWMAERAGDWHTASAFELLSYTILGGLFAFAVAYFLIYPYLELRRQHGILQKQEETLKSEQTKLRVQLVRIAEFAGEVRREDAISSTTQMRRRLAGGTGKRQLMSSPSRDEEEERVYIVE